MLLFVIFLWFKLRKDSCYFLNIKEQAEFFSQKIYKNIK